jgi:enoyl-CoA hydratase/carnithine racemase
MNEAAPNNERAIIATMQFYLATGDFEALDSLAALSVAPFIDRPGWAGTELLFERVGWAATARLALGDARGARDLLEKGLPDLAQLDPQPVAADTLSLMARVRREDGDPEGSAEIAASAAQLIKRARAEGWDDMAFANYSK